MQRITRKDLDRLASRINEATGSPLFPWDDADGRLIASPGNYHIDCAYGGFSLHRMSNTSGGVSDVFSMGHMPARELHGLMYAFLIGYRAHERQMEQA